MSEENRLEPMTVLVCMSASSVLACTADVIMAVLNSPAIAAAMAGIPPPNIDDAAFDRVLRYYTARQNRRKWFRRWIVCVVVAVLVLWLQCWLLQPAKYQLAHTTMHPLPTQHITPVAD